MRFMHAADLHIGLRVTRFGAETNGRLQEARIESLDRMLRIARTKSLDFLLLAGDLFDDNHIDTVTARRTLELLESVHVPVYLIPGNHDPLTADSVYTRPPWSLIAASSNVVVLRGTEAVAVPGGVVYPCPLTAKNSLDDPTRTIPPRAAGDSAIRIGLAHGSLNDRPNLPPDDHLIDRHTVDAKGLDYLALGHWHSPSRHADRAGVVRTVYPGVHEPMRFRDAPEFAIGWSAYSSASPGDNFGDDGRGRALIVEIDRAGAAPLVEEIDTTQFEWRDETFTLRDEADLSRLINELAHREQRDRQLLRLHLVGTLPASARLRLDELDQTLSGGQGGVLTQYRWFDLDVSRLLSEPSEDELRNLAGDGIVRQVHDRLKAETASADVRLAEVARQSLLLLYRFTHEVQR